jgi:hypothetical protein
MSAASAIPAPLSAQVILDVIRTDSFQAYPAAYYMGEKMAAITRVLFDGPPTEIALAHVFAQCDQPTLDLLSRNVCLRGEAVSKMMRRRKGFGIMRRKIE